MLHCKTEFKPMKQERNTFGGETSQDIKFIEVNVKREIVSDDDICRICLKEGKMPIFGENATKSLCENINEIGAIQVCADDPYPKNLCQSCHALLQGAILFRKTAQKSNELLHYPKEHTKKLEPILKIDKPSIELGDKLIKEKYHRSNRNVKLDGITGIGRIVKCPTIRTCNVCDLQFNSFEKYSEHRLFAKHEKSPIIPRWKCNDCDLKFNTLKDYNDHSITAKDEKTHNACTKLSKWKCNVCNLRFNSYKECSEHRLTTEHKDKCITCPICKKTYGRRYFKRHLSFHKKENEHLCDTCGKSFTSHWQLTQHRLIHSNDLPFKCSTCPYRARISESLKMHMRSHTGEKPYQCDQCPSRFISKSNLNKHVLTHKGKFDFHCEFCGRGFYTKRTVELHIKADHTGKKEHACRICGKAFGYRRLMMKHERRVHKRDKLISGRMPVYLKLETMKQQIVEGELPA